MINIVWATLNIIIEYFFYHTVRLYLFNSILCHAQIFCVQCSKISQTFPSALDANDCLMCPASKFEKWFCSKDEQHFARHHRMLKSTETFAAYFARPAACWYFSSIYICTMDRYIRLDCPLQVAHEAQRKSFCN